MSGPAELGARAVASHAFAFSHSAGGGTVTITVHDGQSGDATIVVPVS
jgi:hypothetical protein